MQRCDCQRQAFGLQRVQVRADAERAKSVPTQGVLRGKFLAAGCSDTHRATHTPVRRRHRRPRAEHASARRRRGRRTGHRRALAARAADDEAAAARVADERICSRTATGCHRRRGRSIGRAARAESGPAGSHATRRGLQGACRARRRDHRGDCHSAGAHRIAAGRDTGPRGERAARRRRASRRLAAGRRDRSQPDRNDRRTGRDGSRARARRCPAGHRT